MRGGLARQPCRVLLKSPTRHRNIATHMNPRLGALQPYPFEKLRQLLAQAATPPAGLAPINLSIGEPKHDTHAVLIRALRDETGGLAKYPPNKAAAILPRKSGRQPQRERVWQEVSNSMVAE